MPLGEVLMMVSEKLSAFWVRKGRAHVDIGLALVHGDGLLTAGVVAAGTAVELLLGGVLAHLLEDFLDFLFTGHLAVQADEAVVLNQILAVGLGHLEVLGAGVAVHRDGVGDRTAALTLHAGPPIQLPAQMDISMKHFFRRPSLMSSRAARTLSTPSTTM